MGPAAAARRLELIEIGDNQGRSMAGKHRWISITARLAVVAVTATVAATAVLTSPASAHGSVINPAARAYDCWDRWGDRHLAPEMATEDPMCYQAWQYDPQAMWNWNGLFREGVAGNHQGAIPDGTLCSGGRAKGGVYNAMDTIGNWNTTSLSNNFRLQLHDPATHGADYLRVYITRQGFSPTTDTLRWADLELVTETPRLAPALDLWADVNAGSRTGRHIVYTVWQASHLDQSYYFCSDVVFGGGPTGPTTPPTTRVTTPPTTRVTTPPTTRVTTPPTTPVGGCSAQYRIVSQWSGGFQAEVTVTAGAGGLTAWSVAWTFTNGETLGSGWSANFAPNGANITARNVSYNGRVAAGTSTSFGFLGSGVPGTPSVICTAG
jgi:chitin-binding protein